MKYLSENAYIYISFVLFNDAGPKGYSYIGFNQITQNTMAKPEIKNQYASLRYTGSIGNNEVLPDIAEKLQLEKFQLAKSVEHRVQNLFTLKELISAVEDKSLKNKVLCNNKFIESLTKVLYMEFIAGSQSPLKDPCNASSLSEQRVKEIKRELKLNCAEGNADNVIDFINKQIKQALVNALEPVTLN